MPYFITDSCKDVLDRGCVDACPVDCIYEGEDMLYIKVDECIDCDACVGVCPVTAISTELDLPDEAKKWLKIADTFFQENPDAKVAEGSFNDEDFI